MNELGTKTRITSENAREMHKKSVKAKLSKKYFIEVCGKEFHKVDKDAFKALSDKAAAGDIQALEQLRKWIFGEDEDKRTDGGNNILIQVGKDEAVAIDKWSKK